jgi:hypothetical protein
LKFPISQGSETISGDLTVTGEVLTTSVIDTIDDVAGTLAIGTTAGRTGNIQIGTGTTGTGKTITINGLASANTTTINGGAITIAGSGGQTTTISNTGILTLSNGNSSAINIGSTKTGGTIDIGMSGGTASTTTINIGTGSNHTGTIEIGTGGSNRNITIGSVASTANSTFIRGFTVAVNPNVTTGALNLGQAMTGGTIDIGQNGATSSSTIIGIGNGSNQTGNINIGTGGTTFKQITIGNTTGAGGTLILGSQTISVANTSNTTALNLGTGMTGGAVILGGTTGGTSTLTVNRPIAPAYLPSAIGVNNIGYQTSSTNNTYTSAIAGIFEVMNTGSITAGVWMVEGCFVFSGATGGGRRMGLNTASAVMLDTRTQGVATGSFAQLAVSSIFSFSTATTVYLNIDITAGLGGSGTNISTLRWTRLA